MKRLGMFMMLAAGTLLLGGQAAQTPPQPAPINPSWQLDIDYSTPQAISVTLPGSSVPKRFWFMKYTVTNRTGDERLYVPEFSLYTDTGELLRSGQNVPTAVFAAIKGALNDPLLKDQTEMTGRLLQGDDNAKTGVAIWPDFDPKAGLVDIFVTGLSGETAVVKLPVAVEVTEIDVRGQKRKVKKEEVVLTKTLQLTYSIPGEAASRYRTPMKMLRTDWIMR